MNIIVMLPKYVGDSVMATPAIELIASQFPKANIDIVCKPYIAGLFETPPIQLFQIRELVLK